MTQSDISIRPVLANQIMVLMELARQTFDAAFAHQNNPDDFAEYMQQQFTLARWQHDWQQADKAFFMAWKGTQPVGYIQLNVHAAQNEFKDQPALEIERIYTATTHQGMGIGAMLLQMAEAIARQQHKQFIWLGVWEKNEAAIRFYQRHGFEKAGTHPFVIGQDVQTDWLMKKIL